MLVGLWLTPFYLRSLGPHDYGVWLVGLQILTFLALVDLGILSVLPRDVAQAHGMERDAMHSAHLQLLLARTAKVVLIQTFFMAVTASALFFLRGIGSGLSGPLGLILIIFVLTYPLRLFGAVLQGLQDFKFITQVRLWTWGISTVLAVVLLVLGARFYALAWAWCAQEIGLNLAGFLRLRRIRPDLVRPAVFKSAGAMRWQWFMSGFWVSLSQIATSLVAGADVLIIARTLGPASVVIYSCTCKLVWVMQNQPQVLASLALPGLSHMKTSERPERILNVTNCLGQAMLCIAGAVFCVVLALNRRFVTLWVGGAFFGGTLLTALVLTNFVLRMIDYTLGIALFALGHEKAFAIRSVLDGLMSVGLAAILVKPLGLPGIAMGFLCISALMSIPVDLYLLARGLGVPFLSLVRPYVPYVWRFAAIGAAAYWILLRLETPNLFVVGLAALLIGISYVLLMIPHVLRCELAPYVKTSLTTVWSVIRHYGPIPSGASKC